VRLDHLLSRERLSWRGRSRALGLERLLGTSTGPGRLAGMLSSFERPALAGVAHRGAAARDRLSADLENCTVEPITGITGRALALG
jgi:hypothetical protein